MAMISYVKSRRNKLSFLIDILLFSWFFHPQTAFTTQKDFGKEAREAKWATEQRTLHGLQSRETKMFAENHTFRDINIMAEEAKRRAEIARSVYYYKSIITNHTSNFARNKKKSIFLCCIVTRLRELHTLKGRVESFAKLRGLDIDVNPHYTV